MGKKLIKYTVSVYTEDSVGLLNRISAIFQKRHINIESFNSSMTEIENVQYSPLKPCPTKSWISFKMLN